jgi:hypothetical protein
MKYIANDFDVKYKEDRYEQTYSTRRVKNARRTVV